MDDVDAQAEQGKRATIRRMVPEWAIIWRAVLEGRKQSRSGFRNFTRYLARIWRPLVQSRVHVFVTPANFGVRLFEFNEFRHRPEWQTRYRPAFSSGKPSLSSCAQFLLSDSGNIQLFLPYARRFRDMGFPMFRTVDGMPHEFSGSAHRDVALPVPFFFKPGAS